MINLNALAEKAKSIAQKSRVKRAKIGAILISSSGHILASACNARVDGGKDFFTIHAEQFVLSKAHRMKIFDRFSKKEIMLLTSRWAPSKDGRPIARPCKPCMAAIRSAGIKTIYFTNAKNEICMERL